MHIDNLHTHLWLGFVPYLVLKVPPKHTSTSFRDLVNLFARQSRHRLDRFQLFLLTLGIPRSPGDQLGPIPSK